MASHNYSDEFLANFFPGEIYASDPRMPFIERVQPGSVYADELLYDREEMDRDPWVRESTVTLGVESQLGMKLRLPDDNVVTFGLLRTRREGLHWGDDIGVFRRLLPHLEQACALGHVIEREVTTRTALLEALSLRTDGVIVIDRFGAPSFMNDAARALLAAGDGLAFVDGQFRTTRPPETRRLAQLIAHATPGLGRRDQPVGGQMLVSRPSALRPYIVRVMPSPALDCFLSAQSIGCVLHVQDLSASHALRREPLAAIFGLSEREADVTMALVRTAQLGTAASAAGMSLNTARNHLQSIFRKTDTANQAALLQLLARIG